MNENLFDAFGRSRVSSPFTLFSTKQTNGNNSPLLHTEFTSTGGTATYSSATSSTTLAVTTASGSRAVRQTKLYCPYQPGKSQLVFASVVLGAGQANTKKRVGYYDDNHGFFFELHNTTLSLMVRNSTVDTTLATQTNWNIDKMDGTGPSRTTLDLTKIQVFVVDFTWLGAGRVRFGWLIEGQIEYCHEYIISNTLSNVSILNPSLPVRYEIVNTGAALSTSSISQICCMVASEGGFDPKGLAFGASRGISAKSIGTTLIPLMSIRLKSANSRSLAIPLNFSTVVDAAQTYRYSLRLNPTLTASSFASVNTNSYMEVDLAATSLTGGTELLCGYTSQDLRSSSQDLSRLTLGAFGSNYVGTPDILTIAVQTITGATRNFYGSINWLEVD